MYVLQSQTVLHVHHFGTPLNVRIYVHFFVPMFNPQGKEIGWEGPPFEVDGSKADFCLAVFGYDNNLFYPLIINESYSLDVS